MKKLSKQYTLSLDSIHKTMEQVEKFRDALISINDNDGLTEDRFSCDIDVLGELLDNLADTELYLTSISGPYN